MDTPMDNMVVGRAVEWTESNNCHPYYNGESTSYRGKVLAFELDKHEQFQLLVLPKRCRQGHEGAWAPVPEYGAGFMTVPAMGCRFPTLEPDAEIKTDDTFRKQA